MTTLKATEINLSSLAKLTEGDARKLLERLRWPNGPVCAHCGVIGKSKRMRSAEESATQLRDGVLNCRACRKPFSVTVGTTFEGSHSPLSKWLLGFFLFASAKESMSALQLQRQLSLGSYRTAWHMAHRIRHAMQNDPSRGPLSGIVEADETYASGKLRRKAGAGRRGASIDGRSPKRRQSAQIAANEKRLPVAVLVSRDGQARAKAKDKVTGSNLKSFLRKHADVSGATLNTDKCHGDAAAGKEFAGGH